MQGKHGFLIMVTSIVLMMLPSAMAQNRTLKAEVRHRPPEMIVDHTNYTGPLIDILKELAERAGFEIRLQDHQFKGSLERLKRSQIDLLPRTICSKERAAVIDYLGPIGYQEKEIVFIVKPGEEKSISHFDDLLKHRIGSKRGTYYFKEFVENKDIIKIEAEDDENLAMMFKAGRLTTFIALDKKAAVAALKKHGVSEYTFADYKYIMRIGNYFGIARDHDQYELLQNILEKMVVSGRIKEIYNKHGLTAPVFEIHMGFEKCVAE